MNSFRNEFMSVSGCGLCSPTVLTGGGHALRNRLPFVCVRQEDRIGDLKPRAKAVAGWESDRLSVC